MLFPMMLVTSQRHAHDIVQRQITRKWYKIKQCRRTLRNRITMVRFTITLDDP